MTRQTDPAAVNPLRYALVAVGIMFVDGIFPLMHRWPAAGSYRLSSGNTG